MKIFFEKNAVFRIFFESQRYLYNVGRGKKLANPNQILTNAHHREGGEGVSAEPGGKKKN